ncbi:MAG: hypothetical protein IPG97_15865 [Microthrixaceae bacterium]|nr:hypothetical protein [Microthrixaceae bacterium]
MNRPVEVSRADLGHLIELAMLATDRTPDEQAVLQRAITTGAHHDLWTDGKGA